MTATKPDAFDMTNFSWNTTTPEQAKTLCEQAQQAAGLKHSEADGGFHLAARHADVVSVMEDTDTFSSWPTVLRPMAPNVPPFTALEYDPPQHGPWRDVFRELVNPRTVKRLQTQVFADVTRHIDTFIEAGSCDLVHDLAEYVPAETICRAAGVEDMDLALEIRDRTQAALDVAGKDPEMFTLRIMEFGELVMPLIQQRRANPREDFLTRLADAQPDGRPLQAPELVSTMFGLLAAGHHSTTSSISTLLLDVITRVDVRQRIAEDPKIVTTVIEESLRRDPPFYGFFRRATTTAVVAGTAVEPEDSVCLSWVGANNDPVEFERPDEFRLDRAHYKHVAFGHGIHTCVGAPLARLELKIALEQVLARMPDVELVGPAPKKLFGGAGATYIPALPVRFTPGSRLQDADPPGADG